MLGVAYQRGLLPVSGASIEKAMELNGVAVESNLAAFRLGRRIAVEPELLAQLEQGRTSGEGPKPLTGKAADAVAAVDADPELAEILAWRVPELIEYENLKYARRYGADIAKVRNVELRLGVDRSDLSQTVARQLFKLMAYKDEYEVARLALNSDIADRARQRFGPNAKVSYRLKPPSMKLVGYGKKISVAEAAGRKMFQGLRKTKKLRGKRLDPFGQTEERRTERQLIDDYRSLVETLLAKLTAENYDQAVEIADLADQIRGYDVIKLANV